MWLFKYSIIFILLFPQISLSKFHDQNGKEVKETIQLERPYKLDNLEKSRLKNQLYSCLNREEISDPEFQDFTLRYYFYISVLRIPQFPELVNKNNLENPNFKNANDLIMQAFENPNCKRLLLPLSRYEEPRDIVIDFDFNEIQSYFKNKDNSTVIVKEINGIKCAGDSQDGKFINGLAYCKEAFANYFIQMNNDMISQIGLIEKDDGERILGSLYGKKFDGMKIKNLNRIVKIEKNAIEWGQGHTGPRFVMGLDTNSFEFQSMNLENTYLIFLSHYENNQLVNGSIQNYDFDINTNQLSFKDSSFTVHFSDSSQILSLEDLNFPKPFANAYMGKINADGYFVGPIIEIKESQKTYFIVDSQLNWQPIDINEFQSAYGEQFDSELDLLYLWHADIQSFWDDLDFFLNDAEKIGIKKEAILENLEISDSDLQEVKNHYQKYIELLN